MNDSDHRDALARVIDPEAWALYDDKRLINRDPKIKEMMVENSRAVALRIMESGLLASVIWDRREFIEARAKIIEGTSRTGKCESVEDGLDGYMKHDPRCPLWPDTAVGGGTTCQSWS